MWLGIALPALRRSVAFLILAHSADRLLRPSLETSHHPAFPHSQHFTTFSDPALSAAGPSSEGTHYVFASSSCIKPGFPYTGPHHKLETKGAKEFLKIAERVGVKFMLFLGDIIYSDVPWYAGKSVERYFKHYRQLFSSPEVKAMVEKIRKSSHSPFSLSSVADAVMTLLQL